MNTTWKYMVSALVSGSLALVMSGCSSNSGTISDPNNPNPTDPNDPNDPGTTNPTSGAAGFLHTQGGQIVDSNGAAVRLTGVSWFGMEDDSYAPHGLDKRSLGAMLDQIKAVGFNTVRIPFCTQMFDSGSTPRNIDFGKNPELQGKKPIELLDVIIKQAGDRGLRIILDRHRPDAYSQSELWFTGKYNEQRWLDDWKMLATRYKGNQTVIGFDLHNEPHGQATWGDGNMGTDWRAAAQRAGNAILAIHPDILIIVEGIEIVQRTDSSENYYWWGGNLTATGAKLVELSSPGHVVYSPHDYPASLYGQRWFNAGNYPNNLPGIWDSYWGYLVKEQKAPIWIGEFGTKLETDSDKKWLGALVSYITTNKLSFSYWSWNPDSGDTGGILKDDWSTLQQAKVDAIKPALAGNL